MRYMAMKSAPFLSISGLRGLNTYELTGSHPDRCGSVEDLVINHLMLVRELRLLNAYEEVACRMLAEGYTYADISIELGVSVRTVTRFMTDLKFTLYGVDLADAKRKVQ